MATSNIGKVTSQSSENGFSLVELMISIAIISTALLFIIGVFTTGMKANRKAVDLTAGTLVAESVISQELYNILSNTDNNLKFFAHNDKSKEFVKGTQTQGNTVFTYKLYVSDASSDFNTAGNKMKKVDVKVWWWSKTGGAGNVAKDGEEIRSDNNSIDENANLESKAEYDMRAGYGVVSVSMTRLVNQQSKY